MVAGWVDRMMEGDSGTVGKSIHDLRFLTESLHCLRGDAVAFVGVIVVFVFGAFVVLDVRAFLVELTGSRFATPAETTERPTLFRLPVMEDGVTLVEAKRFSFAEERTVLACEFFHSASFACLADRLPLVAFAVGTGGLSERRVGARVVAGRTLERADRRAESSGLASSPTVDFEGRRALSEPVGSTAIGSSSTSIFSF